MKRRGVVLGLVCVAILVAYVDRGNLSIATVEIMRDFGLSPVYAGTLLSAFFWTYGLFQLPAGAVIDRYGIRGAYAGAFLLWSGACAATALANGFTSLLSLRLLLGMAEAVAPLASIAFIRRAFGPGEQGVPTSIYIAGQTLGPGLGAWLGTILLQSYGWRMMFAVTGLGALLWLMPWLALAPRGRGRSADDAPTTRAVPWTIALRTTGLWALTAGAFLLAYFWYFVLTWVPTYLRVHHAFGVTEMGRIMAWPLVAMAFTSVLAGWVADRLARRWDNPIRARLTMAAAGMTGCAALLLLPWAPDRSWALPMLFIAMASFGVGNSNYWALAQAAAPADLIGRLVAYLNTLAQLAGALAPIITGWLIGPSQNYGPALVIAGLCPLVASTTLGGVGWWRLKQLRDRLSVTEA